MKILFTILSIYLTSFALDMCWLGFLAKDFYKSAIFGLMRKSGEMTAPHWGAALLVYVAISLGIYFFVLDKADNSYLQALFWGAVFGAVVYGIYDFTNFAILANWPFQVSLVDFIWGITLCSLSSLVGFTVKNLFAH